MLVARPKVLYDQFLANTPENKVLRFEYARRFMENERLHFIFIDEFSFSIGLRRNFGRPRADGSRTPVSPMMQAPN
jgi:hypothetical protein